MRLQAFTAAVAVSAALLVGCSGEAEYFSASETAAMGSVMAADLRSAANRSAFPLRVTQAEFQDADGETWWVTQFEDPVLTGAASGMRFDYAFPIDVVRDALNANRETMDKAEIATFIVAFKDPDQTVFEIDADDLYAYADGDMDLDDLMDRSLISSLNR